LIKLTHEERIVPKESERNYIAGEWLAGASEIENRNPSDLSDLLGLYAQADTAQLNLAITAASPADMG
jgi:aldehyde dehydrogenase (NAD+)